MFRSLGDSGVPTQPVPITNFEVPLSAQDHLQRHQTRHPFQYHPFVELDKNIQDVSEAGLMSTPEQIECQAEEQRVHFGIDV